MSRAPQTFDRLARVYRGLEFLAFGRDLERARFCFLEHLRGAQNILVIGEGDGRFLERLAQIAPSARIECLDASAGMLARAAERIAGSEAASRVKFIHDDALQHDFGENRHDAVVTLFFLDCFTEAQVRGLVERIGRSLRPGGQWLFADFALPATGIARWRAKAWLGLLYTFFRWQTGIAARRLPPSEAILAAAGLQRVAAREWQHGLLRSAAYRKPGLTAA
jgi:ubiquinone/menaquinone biosynthesis C-methylase UbiE